MKYNFGATIPQNAPLLPDDGALQYESKIILNYQVDVNTELSEEQELLLQEAVQGHLSNGFERTIEVALTHKEN